MTGPATPGAHGPAAVAQSAASPSTTPVHRALVARIDAALPQTQCQRCGYPDCLRYAEAIAAGEAAINQCPPGGVEGIERLAHITGQAVRPLSAEHGIEGPLTVAVIDEQWCIGCTKCLEVCPTDAIVGTHKQMHTVIEPHCTGCELCIPVCPVDCIGLEPVSGSATGWAAWSPVQAESARKRYQQRRVRLGQDQHLRDAALAPPTAPSAPPQDAAAARQAAIAAALQRARERQARARPAQGPEAGSAQG
ncbi:RnfABCDGE type electron transport complex subunit B [Acidovorax lacteus]|uniref:Rnf electron transport complex subunit B n=1 Tax=Acidovorax lacteus TaxID=1924988 RepID=A0ABP8L4F3_9BURK